MPVFMIVPTEDADRLERVVTKTFEPADRFILPGKQACFVKFNGTSQEIAQKLDLAGDQNKEDRPCPAVITLGVAEHAQRGLRWLTTTVPLTLLPHKTFLISAMEVF